MTVEELYEELHGDFADACKRLMNREVVSRFVVKFPEDPSMQNLRDAIAAGDIETSFRSVHTLKGLAGSLGLTQLYQKAVNLTEQLRPRLDQADPELMKILEDEYKVTIDALKRFIASR